MFARGIEQQLKGVDNVSAYTNMALVTGKIGRPKAGVATFTGQGNGQGGREHGQKADLLPGYRKTNESKACGRSMQRCGELHRKKCHSRVFLLMKCLD